MAEEIGCEFFPNGWEDHRSRDGGGIPTSFASFQTKEESSIAPASSPREVFQEDLPEGQLEEKQRSFNRSPFDEACVKLPENTPASFLREGFLGTGLLPKHQPGFFRRNFKESPFEGAYEPQKGFEEVGAYWKYLWIRVFDPSYQYFMLRKEGGKFVTTKDPASSITMAKYMFHLFMGYHDILNYYEKTKDGKTTGVLVFFYIILGGFIFTPLMNIVKLFTELPLKFLAELCGFIKDSCLPNMQQRMQARNTKGLNSDKAWYALKSLFFVFIYLLFGVSQLIFEALHVLLRMITSPIESSKAGFHSGYGKGMSAFLGTMSIFGSLILWSALILVAGPALAFLATQLGISLTLFGHVGALTRFSSPLMSVLTALGFASTPLLTGAVALATPVLAFLGLNEFRRVLYAVLEPEDKIENIATLSKQ